MERRVALVWRMIWEESEKALPEGFSRASKLNYSLCTKIVELHRGQISTQPLSLNELEIRIELPGFVGRGESPRVANA